MAGVAGAAGAVALGGPAARAAAGRAATSQWEDVVSGSLASDATLAQSWNGDYPWGTDHNGSARMTVASGSRANLWLDNGVLVIRANPVPPEGQSSANPHPTIHYHSGALHARSQIVVTDQFPNYEVRGDFQVPTARGTWPAFWMTAVNGWPPESDVLEFKGDARNWFNTFRTASDVSSTVVPVSSPGSWHTYRTWMTKVGSTTVDFHYYVDGVWKAVHHATGFVGKPMWLIINLQMEGSSGSPGPTSDTYYRARNLYVGRTRVS